MVSYTLIVIGQYVTDLYYIDRYNFPVYTN